MASQNKTSTVPDTKNTALQAPAAGERILVADAGTERFAFEFSPDTSTFSRQENDLIVGVRDGGKVVVENFFAVGAEGSLPDFALPDGTVVAGEIFLRAHSPDIDISTAAGSAQPISTSGLGAYDDGAGSLLGGIDRLGSLGTDQWGGSRERTEVPPPPAALVQDEGTNHGAPVSPPVVPPVIRIALSYDARAVLFTQDTAAAPMIAFSGVNLAGENRIVWHDNAFQSFFDASTDTDGQLTLTLNQAGKNGLAANGTGNAYGYISIIDANGTAYTVQVVLNQSDDVVSRELDAEKAEDNGGRPLVAGGLRHGEWHQGQALTDGNLSASDLNDHIRFTGTVSGSTIDAGRGDDVVFLGGLKDTNTVTADGGSVTVENVTPGTTAYAMSTDGGTNTIDADSANIFLTASGNAGIVMSVKNGSNIVETKLGDITLAAHSDINASSTGMIADTGGTNTLVAGAGSVSLDVSGQGGGYGLQTGSVSAGHNDITAGKDIDIDVHVAKFAYGMTGQGTLKAGNDITITATSTEFGGTGINNAGTTLVEAGGTLTVKAANLQAATVLSHMNAGTTGVSNSSGRLDVQANHIDIAASTTGNRSSATGVVQTTGTTTISAKEDVVISATKHSVQDGTTEHGAKGIYTWGDANTSSLSVTSATGDITVRANDNGILTTGSGGSRSEGANAVNLAGGNVDVVLTAEKGKVSLQVNQGTADYGSYAWGVNNQGSGQFTLDARQAEIHVAATKGAIGLFAQKEGVENRITADSIDMNIYGKESAVAMSTYQSDTSKAGTNTLTARTDAGTGQVNINLSGGASTALSAARTGQNSIDADHVSIHADAGATSWATGLGASDTATNTLRSNDVGIELRGFSAKGLTAGSVGTTTATNLVQGTGENATFTLNMTATGGVASGMDAGAGGENTVTDFSSVTLTGSALGNAYGLYAHDSGASNTVNATEAVRVDVTSTSAGAFALGVANAGENTVSANSVELSAQGVDSNAKSYGMYTKVGTNTIQAHDDAQGMDVYITATAGTLDKAYAMYAETGWGGVNQIIGSSQADLVRLEGGLYADSFGHNTILTGAGNDRIEIDGKIANAASLELKTGDGYDTLVLHAKDFVDFQNRYSGWLTGTAFAGIEIEHIHVVIDSLTVDQQDVLNWFTSNMPSAGGNVSVAYDHSAQFTEATVHRVDYDHTAYAATDSSVEGKDLHFHSAGDDYVHIKGDVTDSVLTFDAGHDALNISGTLSESVVHTDESFAGTLHVDAGALENTHLELLGGTNAVTLHGNVDSDSLLVLGSGDDTLLIQGDFTGHAGLGGGDDYVVLQGHADGGVVDGGAGNDTLQGDAGGNILVGGSGHDVLSGGVGADTFVWKAEDKGTVDAPTTDVILDFNSAEGDMLDLSALLGSDAKDHLESYMSISHDNGNTMLSISTSGESTEGRFDQVIILQNSNLTEEYLLQHLLLNHQ